MLRGGPPIVRRARRRPLGRADARRAGAGDDAEGAEALTATERQIAGLAADGLTNQAIAEQVFVSRKTVEANLARAYRKLGISSRAQLSRALDELQAQSIS